MRISPSQLALKRIYARSRRNNKTMSGAIDPYLNSDNRREVRRCLRNGLHSRRSVSSSSPPATNQKALDPGTREHLTRLGVGPEKRNTDLEPNRVNISRRLEGTHSESPEARPEVRTRPRVCDSQGFA